LELTYAFLSCAAYEFSAVPSTLSVGELKGEAYKKATDTGEKLVKVVDDTDADKDTQAPIVEYKCHFYEWATAYQGMIAVQRKQRSNFRHQTAAETAAPVIVCAVGKGLMDEMDWQFAGIVRSNSVRTVDDGMG
jgi:hypothetical protein